MTRIRTMVRMESGKIQQEIHIFENCEVLIIHAYIITCSIVIHKPKVKLKESRHYE